MQIWRRHDECWALDLVFRHRLKGKVKSGQQTLQGFAHTHRISEKTAVELLEFIDDNRDSNHLVKLSSLTLLGLSVESGLFWIDSQTPSGLEKGAIAIVDYAFDLVHGFLCPGSVCSISHSVSSTALVSYLKRLGSRRLHLFGGIYIFRILYLRIL